VAIPQILQRGDAVFEEHHTLPAYVRKAVGALLACRSARLGGHIQACPEGHVKRVWYNSCRHRRCAPYVWLQVERWRVRQRPRLLACDHDHVTFTVPDELRGLRLANSRAMTPLWFATVRETLGELRCNGQYVGAWPGIIATLHMWSQTLVLPPHLDVDIQQDHAKTSQSPWATDSVGFS